MIKIGNLTLGRTPRIVVPFKDRTSPLTLKQARKRGLDLAELRIDLYERFDKEYVLREIAKFKKIPALATIRSKKEGGRWPLPDKERLKLFAAVIPKVDAVDIELSSKSIRPAVVKLARKAKKRVIISYHNFDGTPGAGKLKKIADEARAAGADIVKIAAMALNPKDVQTLAAFTAANASKNLITISMGRCGAVSRVLFPALGSLMTYAYLGKANAPGQLPYDKTSGILKILYPQNS